MDYANLYFAISYAWAFATVIGYRKQPHKTPAWFNLLCIIFAPIALPIWVLMVTFNVIRGK
jgi:hypothetical protein